MKKNLVKAMLFGACIFSIPFLTTGCKDYDDDINELNHSLTETNADLSTKAKAVESSIESLQAAQNEICASITKAEDIAEKAALQAKAEAIASALESMKTLKSELSDLIASKTNDITLLNQKAAAAEEKLVTLSGQLTAIQKMLIGYEELVESVGRLQSAMNRLDEVDNSLKTMSVELDQAIKDIAIQQTMLETQQRAIKNLETLSVKQSEDLVNVKDQITQILKSLDDHKALLDKAASKDDIAAVKEGILKNQQSIADLNQELGKIDSKLNILKSFFYSMITSLNLIEDGLVNNSLTVVKCTSDIVFGDGLPGAITFKKDEVYTASGTPLIIQVSPSTATLTADQIRLVRSDGEDLSPFIDLTIRRYGEEEGEILTTKSTTTNGLWVVTTQLKVDYDRTKFNKMTYNETTSKQYLFALATRERISANDAERQVMSQYKLTFSDSGSNYVALSDINASTINDLSILQNQIPIQINKPFSIKVKSSNPDSKIHACYLSYIGDDDMKVIYRSFNITAVGGAGLETVKVGDEITLNVGSQSANNHSVHFTLHAIDIAGNAIINKNFYIACGMPISSTPALNLNLISEIPNAGQYLDMAKPVLMTTNLVSTDADAKKLVGGSYSVSIKNMTVSADLYKSDLSTLLNLNSVDNIKAISAVRLNHVDLLSIPDNSSITGHLIFKNSFGLQVLDVPLTIKKSMPAFPTDFSVKTNLMDGGIITVYPTFTSSTTKATFEYDKIFNMINSANSSYFKFATLVDQKGAVDFSHNDMIQVDNKLVGKSKGAIGMNVSYNYGMISTETKDNLWKPLWNTPFAIKFASIPEESTIALEKAFEIIYPVASNTLVHHTVLKDGGYIMTKADDKDQKSMKLIVGLNDMKSIKVKTVSGNNVVNEYYTPSLNNDGSILFTKNSDSAVINNNVSTTLVITIEDVFGNTFNKELNFMVVKP